MIPTSDWQRQKIMLEKPVLKLKERKTVQLGVPLTT
jgi:hypothetical protein